MGEKAVGDGSIEYRIYARTDATTLRIFPGLAREIGLSASILLLQIDHWISIARDPDRPGEPLIRDGRRWTYQSVRDMQRKAFSFWSDSTINRAANKLEKLALVFVTSKYNEHEYDRTRWFALNPAGFVRLKSVVLMYQAPDGTPHIAPAPGEKTLCHFDTPLCHFDTGVCQNDTTIPEITPEITPEGEPALPDAKASSAPPVAFRDWRDLVNAARNPVAVLGTMILTLYDPEGDRPEYADLRAGQRSAYGRIGATYARCNKSAAHLAQLLWENATRDVNGHVLDYIDAILARRRQARRRPAQGSAVPGNDMDSLGATETQIAAHDERAERLAALAPRYDTTLDHIAMWDEVLVELGLQLPKQVMYQHFGGSEMLGIEDRVALIGVRSVASVPWVERLSDKVIKAMTMAGCPVDEVRVVQIA